MTLIDLLDLSIDSLRRTRLRTALTVSGVLIAIAAFVSLMSFGAGNRKHIVNLYKEFGLFTHIKVYPQNVDEFPDSLTRPPLDGEAIGELQQIPGIVVAFPYENIEIDIDIFDTTVTASSRILPIAALQTTLYRKILNGSCFSSDSAKEAIVTYKLAEQIGLENLDTLLGQQIVVRAYTASLDSALLNVVDDNESTIWQRFRAIELDSLFEEEYRRRIMNQEISEGMHRFLDGLMNRRLAIEDTLTIIGIGPDLGDFAMTTAPIIINEQTAKRFYSQGFIIGSDVINLFSAMKDGRLFGPNRSNEHRDYPQVTLELDPFVSHRAVMDSVEALGYRAFSYAEEFKEIQRFFLYYNVGLGVIGLIALITAALGIVNTMIMSIIERRKEIGIIKSLGASEGEIKILFLTESAVIGLAGAALGIVVGWLATRVVSMIMQSIMEREGIPLFEPFAFPLWLIGLAFFFGLVVSILAGWFPSSRAAKLDPTTALRNE